MGSVFRVEYAGLEVQPGAGAGVSRGNQGPLPRQW